MDEREWGLGEGDLKGVLMELCSGHKLGWTEQSDIPPDAQVTQTKGGMDRTHCRT